MASKPRIHFKSSSVLAPSATARRSRRVTCLVCVCVCARATPRDLALGMLLLRVKVVALFVALLGRAFAIDEVVGCANSKLVVRAAEMVDCASLPSFELCTDVVELTARALLGEVVFLRTTGCLLRMRMSCSFSLHRDRSTGFVADAFARDDVVWGASTVIGWKYTFP